MSHKLLVRGGFIRQLAAGSYTMLPLGQRVRLKIMKIIREEMDAIGGQEMVLPTLHPAEVWKQSDRYDLMGENLFKLEDRKGTDLVLGMTEEEIFAMLATELFSYRDLPQIWYQMHTKFRDEPRPKSGLLRVREFTMKDSYTLDIDAPGLDQGFDKHYARPIHDDLRSDGSGCRRRRRPPREPWAGRSRSSSCNGAMRRRGLDSHLHQL